MLSSAFRRRPVQIALAAGVVAAIVVAVVLSFVFAGRGVPAPTDGIGDLPAAALVPADAALYLGIATDPDAESWRRASALLERLGGEAPLEGLRDMLAEAGFDWDEDIRPILGGAVALFFTAEVGEEGAIILRASDVARAEAVILGVLAEEAAVEGDYKGVDYRLWEAFAALAVIGDHLVLAADEAALRGVIDVYRGDVPALADDGDFRRLRNALEGEALAFLYAHPARLMEGALGEAPAEGAPRPDDEPPLDLAAFLGLDEVLAGPMGMVVRADEASFRLHAAVLGEAGPLVHLLRPRESRFAALVPAETALFLSAYDLAAVADEIFGARGLTERLRELLAEAAGEESPLARLEALIELLDGEVALAMWPDADGAPTGLVLAEVADEARATEILEALLAEAAAGEAVALSIADGYIALGDAAAIERVRSGGGPALAGSARYAAAVEALGAPLTTFAWLDLAGLARLGPEGAGELGPGLDGDPFAVIVNLILDGDQMQVEALLALD